MAVPCHMGQRFWDGDHYEPVSDDCVWDKQAGLEYMKNTKLSVIYNYGHFQQDIYGDDTISKTAKKQSTNVDENHASYFQMEVQKNHLQDTTSLMQLDGSYESEFNSFEISESKPSLMQNWPTKEDPEAHYRYTGIFILQSPDVHFIERQTYSLLEWLGDIGGLFDALRYLGCIVIGPLNALALTSKLLVSIFKVKQTPASEIDDQSTL